MTSAVVAEHLVKRYESVVGLDDVSFEIDSSELFGFIGPDGGGKTTLFRILSTLLVPDSGTARVLGQDVVREMWALRRVIGYMPGRFALYPDLSVEENLRFFASVFGTTVEAQHEQIAPIYEQLAPFRARRVSALSGGMKQKLALCCALVHRPEILLLDEPTTGVDAVSRREFWDLLDTLRAGGLTIVVSTPYMDEAGRCDRVALVQHGRLLAIDTPAAVARTVERAVVAVAATDRYRALQLLRTMPNAYSVYPFGDTLHYTDARADARPEDVARDLVAHLASHGLGGATARPIAPTIEDAFIALMGSPDGEEAAA
ncbi:MAG TPA: ABC transporter ATP-binding protein [Gemmatimonadaceae bacterium]|nr:ABC transporter ATP-binding protein [Gemmatimonadaceae bacterium]